MNFSFNKSIEILERTPKVLELMLENLSDEWTMNNEGADTWSPFDIVGHLLHGEQTDWMTRTKTILRDSEDKAFKPFDRFAQLEESKGKTINQLLKQFKQAREENLKILKALNISEKDLDKTGIHPKFGDVTLRQLLSTWTVHDISHIAQIARVMCKQYKDAVGPWTEYLSILQK
jgi:hypothetical protein